MKVKRMCLDDYKISNVYAIKDGPKPEWEAQLNIYALMLRERGYTVEKLRIVAILRDWSKSKARHSPEYPQTPALIIPVVMWTAAQTEAYIKARLIAHGTAQHVLPECTPEERWERPGVWAVQKVGGSRALGLHASEEDAESALAEAAAAHPKSKYEIQERPAQQIRCTDYCPACAFCDQGKTLIQKSEDFYATRNVWVVGAPRPTAA